MNNDYHQDFNNVSNNNDNNSKNSLNTQPPLSEPLYGATFLQSTNRFFRKYSRFSGYASRSEYWWTVLYLFLLSLIPLIPIYTGLLFAEDYTVDESGHVYTGSTTLLSDVLFISGLILLLLFTLLTFIPSLAITWRRLHDAGYSGAFYFLSLVTYGNIILLIFLLLPSKPEARRPKWGDKNND